MKPFLVALLATALAFTTFYCSAETAEAIVYDDNRTTEQLLADIRQCESGGDYTAINGAFTEYHFDRRIGSFGGYQFGQGTWDWVATTLGYYGLVGIRPDWVWAPIQDIIARQLIWLERNDDKPGVANYSWSHWGRC